MENKVCASCGSINPSIAMFCKSCGNVFSDGKFIDNSSGKCVSEKTEYINESNLEEITKLKELLTSLSNDNVSLRNRYNTLKGNNEWYEKELKEVNAKNQKLQKDIQNCESKIEEVKGSKGFIHFAYIAICILLSVIFYNSGINNSSTNEISENHIDSHSNDTSENNTDSLAIIPDTPNALLYAISKAKPVIVQNIEVSGDVSDYNKPIYSKETSFIIPKIELISLIEGTVELYIKFITPYGLSTGDSEHKVPKGFSYGEYIYIGKDKIQTFELSGWGSMTKGHWEPGRYKIEIYYRNELIGEKEFEIL
jgi:hypothetical protein